MLVIAGLARGLYGQWRLWQLLAGVIVVAGLTVVTAMLAGVLLIGSFYAAYFTFLHYRWEPQNAILLTGSLFMLTTTIFVVITAIRLRRMLGKSSAITRTGEAIGAFLDGLMMEEVS